MTTTPSVLPSAGIVAGLALAIGCMDAGSRISVEGLGAHADPVALDELEGRLVATHCDLVERCGQPWLSRAQCLAMTREEVSRLMLPLRDLVAAERVRYDADEAGGCLELMGQRCDVYFHEVFGDVETSSCGRIFAGDARAGSACRTSHECRDGLVCGDCRGVSCLVQLGQRACAACRTPDRRGEPCSGSSCEPGDVCVWGGDAWTCWGYEGRLGDVCETPADGRCAGDLQCVWDDPEGPPGHCRSRVEIGEACGVTDHEPWCVVGAMCVAGVCRGITVRGPDETCNAEELPCRSDLMCLDGMCVPDDTRPPPCGDTSASCPEASYCDDRACVPDRADGEACRSSDECATPSWCIPGEDAFTCGRLTWSPCP
ncbi:MAG: hypothetical protein IT385_06390 [Deltaproteobacteria bacterium]|nr:hypothetical protein [Deltaproteobacteria bacterium]